MRRIAAAAAVMVPLAAGLNGCATPFVDKRPMSWQVVVADADKVANCTSKGGVRVAAAAYIWVFKRTDDAIEADLLQLARNAAVDAGGDTLVEGDTPKPGTRNFAIYKCGS